MEEICWVKDDDEEEEKTDFDKIFDLSKISLDRHYFSRPGFACFIEHML